MANFHLEIKTVSRGKGHSIAARINYISGKKIHDIFLEKSHFYSRDDVLFCNVFRPADAPPEFADLQILCDAINNAEKRYDARTAREFIGSLPNELSASEEIKIVSEYIDHNFLSNGLCAVAAIHEGKNEADPSRNNPHVHILVSTRTIEPDGFDRRKDREHDKREYINIWREQWALVQNRAYERNGLELRVSHESLEVQGERDREPTPHLSLADYQREKRGERTPAGDRKREIKARNEERTRRRQLERERGLALERFR